jgi:hypothetical protein
MRHNFFFNTLLKPEDALRVRTGQKSKARPRQARAAKAEGEEKNCLTELLDLFGHDATVNFVVLNKLLSYVFSPRWAGAASGGFLLRERPSH